jgi:hypothetical protein
MFRYAVLLLMMVIGGHANAHQFLPTYPKFMISHISGVYYTKMELFNARKDVEYYELSVYDKDWNSMAFASEAKIIRINYLETKKLNVYVLGGDRPRVTYICSESKLTKDQETKTVIASRICSKVKE